MAILTQVASSGRSNAWDLEEYEFINPDEATQEFDRLVELCSIHDWPLAIRMTAWTPQTEGHMLLIEVTGKALAEAIQIQGQPRRKVPRQEHRYCGMKDHVDAAAYRTKSNMLREM